MDDIKATENQRAVNIDTENGDLKYNKRIDLEANHLDELPNTNCLILEEEEYDKICELNKKEKWIGKHEKYQHRTTEVLTTVYDRKDKKHRITKTHDFVGIIPLETEKGTKTIQIVPRGYPDTNMNYQMMYAYICNIDPNVFGKTCLIGTQQINPVGPIFHATNLYEMISQIERHGLVSNYVNEIEESQFLKGKILWEKSFSKGYFPTEKQLLRTSYLTRDILENRILKEALRITNESLTINGSDDSQIKKKISILYNKFHGVSKLEDNPPKVVYHSLNQKYYKAIDLCLTIIKRRWQILDKDLKPIHARGHLIDINITFQDFLIQFLDEHEIKNLAPKKDKDAESKNVKDEGDAEKDWSFEQRPDMLIKNNANPPEYIIIDAKNKPRLSDDKKPKTNDITQMLIYSKFVEPNEPNLKNSNKVIIVYPETSEKPTAYTDDEHIFRPIDGNPVHIYTKPINMTQNNLSESMHGFLKHLDEKFNVDSNLPKNPEDCDCRLAKYHLIQKKNLTNQQTPYLSN